MTNTDAQTDADTALDEPTSGTVAEGFSPSDSRADRTLATAALVIDIATAAAGELDLEAILHAALDRLGRMVAFTGGSIALVDGDDLVIRAAVGPFQHEALGQRSHRGPGRSWQVIDRLEPVRLDDLEAQGARIAGAEASVAVRSWLAVPIARRNVGIGLLEVDSTLAEAFSAEDEALMATVGRALAGPIDLAARYAAEHRATVLRDAFIGVVSHELRTPITTIFGMSQILRQRHRTMDPETLARSIEDIEAESDRLRRLAEDLLILGRAEGGRLILADDPLIVSHVVKRMVESEAGRQPKHRFVAEVAPGLPLVVGEEIYVGQVIQNLLSNAAKYSPAGTTIRLTASAEDGGVSIRVLDEGAGISDASAEQLFDLFYREPSATRQAAGAGIGLFVCRQLVEGLGGRIWARRRPTAGTEFGFWLPAHVEDQSDEGDPTI